jgi:hypothetical protein
LRNFLLKINDKKAKSLTVVPRERVLEILKELSFNLDLEGYEVMIFRKNKFPFQRIVLTKDNFFSLNLIEYLADTLNISIDEFFTHRI